jgi:hypothetical protein
VVEDPPVGPFKHLGAGLVFASHVGGQAKQLEVLARQRIVGVSGAQSLDADVPATAGVRPPALLEIRLAHGAKIPLVAETLITRLGGSAWP